MTPRPVFIIGSPRSGTSILTWCLGQHSNIWMVPETYWLADYACRVEQFYRLGSAQPYAHFATMDLTRDQVYSWFAQSADLIVKQSAEARLQVRERVKADDIHFTLKRRPDDPKRRWVDGTPKNTALTAPLRQLFPEARFVHIIRNPHEVARSLLHFRRARGRAYGRAQAYRVWIQHVRAALLAERAFGSQQVCRVAYEDLLDRPENLLRTILEFVGEPFQAECLLPLKRRINSSGEDRPFVSGGPVVTHFARRAERLYREIKALPSGGFEADEAELCRLKALSRRAYGRQKIWARVQNGTLRRRRPAPERSG